MDQKMKIRVIAVLVALVVLGGFTIFAQQQRELAEKELIINQATIDNLKLKIAESEREIEERKKQIQEELVEESEPEQKDEPQWKSIGNFKITYYGLDITSNTSTGKKPEIGKTIGVDPEVIPYHSVVMIDGEIYEAQDTGAYKGNLIDILCESEAQSEELGTHYSEVFILEE